MSDIQTYTNRRFPSVTTFEMNAVVEKPDYERHNQFRCRVKIKKYPSQPDSTPTFQVSQTNGGMAYPEVLRAYARLLNHVADKLEGREPIDFQI